MAVTTIDPKTALVLIDLQRGIVGGNAVPHTGAEVVERCVTLADAFRERGLPVVLVHVTSRTDGSDFARGRTQTPRGGPRPADWDVLVDEVTGHDEDIVVTKRNPGAFYGTDLELHLRRRGITQIVLGGIATSIGVEATGRAAYDHGYNVTFATDAMADRDEVNHTHSIERSFPRVGETGTTAEILALLAAV
ncbi:isochorismatase family protein [Cellulomonas sp. JH27-2]|uniref:isochorismatase family protein n=1 Tax=Cellulomonas sp. JH27-2 TaxID=2774139 RepID=UPI00177DAA9A|nr:isochorismatase family protein [Cellulomonas sp. JH27-2]MBD8058156.1 isochorismatase family protein [Cellulomonas sp. JH27-2]